MAWRYRTRPFQDIDVGQCRLRMRRVQILDITFKPVGVHSRSYVWVEVTVASQLWSSGWDKSDFVCIAECCCLLLPACTGAAGFKQAAIVFGPGGLRSTISISHRHHREQCKIQFLPRWDTSLTDSVPRNQATWRAIAMTPPAWPPHSSIPRCLWLLPPCFNCSSC